MASNSRHGSAPVSSIIALYGPTASGKTAAAGALLERLDAEAVSADSAALYAGLPILTAAPSYPTRLVGIKRLSDDVSVGEYQRLAHSAIDEIVAAGRVALVTGGTGLYLRAALSNLELPPPPGPGERERWEAEYDRLGPDDAHGALADRDAAAAARIHPNDRRRVVRALELAEAGASLAPARSRLWESDTRHPTLLVALDTPLDLLDMRIEQRALEMAAAGAADEARAAWRQPLSETARKILGLEAFATLPVGEAVTEVVRATRRLARYQRKWLRRLDAAITVHASRSAEEVADEIVALAGAGQRLPARRE